MDFLYRVLAHSHFVPRHASTRESPLESSGQPEAALLPCPFCGVLDIKFTDSEDYGFIYCYGCGASICVDVNDLPIYEDLGIPLDECPDEAKSYYSRVPRAGLG